MTRTPGLDTIRLAAALAVMWGHAWPIHGGFAGYGYGLEHIGVAVFFLLSGYLVTGSWRRDPHLGRYAARRFLRIWPGLAVAVLFTLGMAMATGGRWDAGYLRWLAFWPQLTIPGAFAGNPGAGYPNTSLWTIPLEVACYAVVLVIGGNVLRWAWLAATVLLWVQIGGPIASLLVMFAVGAVLPTLPRMPWPDPPADLSYGVYLYAFPVQQLAVWLAPGLGALGCLALALPVTLGLAWASWHWVERPAMKFRP